MMKLLLCFFAWPIFCTDLIEPISDPSEINPTELDQTLSDVFLKLIKTNGQLITRTHRLNLVFASISTPDISLIDYIARIRTYLNPESSVMISALIYLDLFLSKTKIILNNKNIHRIFITALNISMKMWSDSLTSGDYVAKIGGLNPQELNALEVDFLFATEFSLCISPERYKQYLDALRKRNAKRILNERRVKSSTEG